MADVFTQLQQECLACSRCDLAQTRTHVVFGMGDPHAEVLFIGEGPGEQEDLQGKPFVGRSGQLLDKMMAAVGMDREQCYIANIVKCRPPANRDPLREEQDACLPWLRQQTKLISPKIIVCLGRIAAMKIIRPDYRMTAEHGQWEQKGGIWFTGFFHPAAILRNPNNKPAAFEDFLRLRDKINEVCERKLED